MQTFGAAVGDNQRANPLIRIANISQIRLNRFGAASPLAVAYFEFVFPSAHLSPCASFTASSFAQKCMKKRCGESSSM